MVGFRLADWGDAWEEVVEGRGNLPASIFQPT